MPAPLRPAISMKRQTLIQFGVLSAFTSVLSVAIATTSFAGSPINSAPPAAPVVHVMAQSQQVASTGTFIAAEAPTTGTARIITEGGHRYLEIDSAFSTTDQAPDLHVLLETASTPPASYATFGSYVNLGGLQKVSGAQRYPIPDSVDVAQFGSVVVWCRMANATMGYAPLTPDRSALR